MFLRWALLAVAAFGTTLSAVPQRQTVERHVLVGVTDATGASVKTLTARDVIVREDGLAREVIAITPAPPPTHVALLVDDTQGEGALLLELRRGITSFLKGLASLQPAPLVSIVTFGDRPETRATWTRNAAQLDRVVQQLALRSGAGSRMLDAIVESCRSLRATSAERPAIVVFVKQSTPEFSDITRTTVSSALKNAGASLWTVHLENDDSPPTGEEQERAFVIGDITRTSGGLNVPILATMSLPSGFTSVLGGLTSRFDVTYGRPDSLIPPSKLSIETRDRTLKIVAPQWTAP